MLCSRAEAPENSAEVPQPLLFCIRPQSADPSGGSCAPESLNLFAVSDSSVRRKLLIDPFFRVNLFRKVTILLLSFPEDFPPSGLRTLLDLVSLVLWHF